MRVREREKERERVIEKEKDNSEGYRRRTDTRSNEYFYVLRDIQRY